MNKPSEDKATITNTIDKSKKPSAAPTKPVKGELSEQELDKASGGSFSWGASNPTTVGTSGVSEIVVTKGK